jgi:hypothetical protein
MNNTEIIIHTHLGLGDHFICNGLIREFISKNNYIKYHIACKKHNKKTVTQMYQDMENVEILSVESDLNLYEIPEAKLFPILRIGHENLDYNINFDESFYKQMDYDFSFKKTKFYINRNPQKEEECFESEVLSTPYIFVHDSFSGGCLDLNISTSLNIVKPNNLNYTPIDYLKVIECAEEIHCVDSSFLNMIDLSIKHNKMFFHSARSLLGSRPPILFNDWKVIFYGDEK